MTLPVDFAVLKRSFARDLELDDRKPKTITVYTGALDEFGEYLDQLPAKPVKEDGAVIIPAGVATMEGVTKAHVRGFLGWLRQRGSKYTDHRKGQPLSQSYINNLYRGLQAFWKWMVTEDYIGEERNPMIGVPRPKVDEVPVPVIADDIHKALLGTCGKGRRRPYKDIRDEAILRVLGDCGVRISELMFTLDDIDPKTCTIRVTGKAGKQRDVHYLSRTAKAIDFYLLERARHPKANQTNAFWLGDRGKMTTSGLYQVVVRRAKMIDAKIHPHQFRHTAAHKHSLKEGTPTSLMRLMGWSSPTMVHRYGASAADYRAREEHRRLAVGDEF
jgi:integrase/recombinase XerC